jgi:peroxiredoxin Q/BCP
MASDGMPAVGAKAPSFSLMGTGGRTVRLKDFAGKSNLVLYFYPRDNTPGCTLEANDFRDACGRFEEHDTVILGVSTDGLEAHERFSTRLDLPFVLLSDPEAEVSTAYGVFGTKRFMGCQFPGIHRTTFVIDKQGTIRRVFPGVRVRRHAAEVLDFVRDELS